MAVRIRMKKMGRKHRPYFRICAVDGRAPRDGRVIEELGTYDPLIPESDARTTLNHERIQYWLGVGAQPSDKVGVLIKKYGPNGTHLAAQQAANEKLAGPRAIPDQGAPAFTPEPPKKESVEPAAAEPAAAAEAPATEAPAVEAGESAEEATAEAAVEEATAETVTAETVPTEETPAAEEEKSE